MNICVTANTSWYLLNFRRGLIERLIADGHSVTILTPLEKRYSERLRELGCTFIPISMTPDKIRLHKELGALVRYITVLFKLRPDIVKPSTITAYHFTRWLPFSNNGLVIFNVPCDEVKVLRRGRNICHKIMNNIEMILKDFNAFEYFFTNFTYIPLLLKYFPITNLLHV